MARLVIVPLFRRQLSMPPGLNEFSSLEDKDAVHAFHSRGAIEVDTSTTGESPLWRVGRL